MNLETMLVASTSHAPSAADCDAACADIATMQREEGALFYAPDWRPDGWPDWLNALRVKAREAGACWVLLDVDAATVDGLPRHEW